MTNRPKPTLDAITRERLVVIDYTNFRGERGVRTILPIRWVFETDNEYHPGPNWICKAWDVAKEDYRDFAQSGIHSWSAANG